MKWVLKVLVGMLFIVIFFCEVVANPRPFVAMIDGELYYPFFVEYADQDFGGFLPTEMNYRSLEFSNQLRRSGNWAVWPLVSWDYKAIDMAKSSVHPSPPSKRHYLGTDNRGRDVLSRLLYGLRLSLLFATAVVLLQFAIGIFVGAACGYFGGILDIGVQRAVEVWESLPYLYILIFALGAFQFHVGILIGVLVIFGWVEIQQLVRIEFLRLRNSEFVLAARSLGLSDARIVLRHILPNALTVIATRFPLRVSSAIGALVSLDFLGLGLPSPMPSLGESLQQGLGDLSAWWVSVPSLIALAALLIFLNSWGERFMARVRA